MDFKVLPLCTVKALLEAFLTPSDTHAVRPVATKPLQVGCYIFLGTHFIESLVKHFLPNTENTFTLYMCTPTHASLQKFYQCCFGIARITQSQFHQSQGMKSSQTLTDKGELPALSFCFTEDKNVEDSYSQGFVLLEHSLQNSKLLKVFLDLMYDSKTAGGPPRQACSSRP